MELSAKLARLGAELLKNILPDYLEGKIKPIEQDHAQATFTKKIQKTEGQIDWSKSAEEIDRQVRALNPKNCLENLKEFGRYYKNK